MNFLQNKPAAVLQQTVSQTLTSGTPAPVTFTGIILDPYSGHSGTNTSRWISPVAAWYWVSGTVQYANVAGGNRSLNVYKNGVQIPYYGGAYPAASAAVFPMVAAPALVFLAVGDYVEIYAYQDSGGSINTQANGSSMAVSLDRF